MKRIDGNVAGDTDVKPSSGYFMGIEDIVGVPTEHRTELLLILSKTRLSGAATSKI
ncbi:hypothetical protein LVJ94_41885 [Pendulispora rubella]|uniref:Uncharacterized protein n=1 Tax=Pendulispora rubella TaxID=2741070 RepID=A0ABZ2KXL9_9BACT